MPRRSSSTRRPSRRTAWIVGGAQTNRAAEAATPLLGIPPATYVEALLGVRRDRGNKVHCPFHPDERASLHVYPTPARGWTCFSCGRGGSIYDLAAGVWGMQTRDREFLQLRELLLERFGAEIALSADRTLQ